MSSPKDRIEQERGQGLRAAGTAVVRAQWREGSQQRRPEGNGQGRREAMWHKVSQGQELPGGGGYCAHGTRWVLAPGAIVS